MSSELQRAFTFEDEEPLEGVSFLDDDLDNPLASPPSNDRHMMSGQRLVIRRT